jgi:gliding motility-associated-like protein
MRCLKLVSKLLFLALLLGSNLAAQLTVTNAPPYNNMNFLVQNVLVGGGVQVSNVTVNAVPQAAWGFFNGVNSNIGLDSGIILTCGSIQNAIPPNNQSGASTSNNLNGDPDLDIIMNPTLSYDATIVEFDFIPMSDTVKFRYVFGSEEYMEYVSSTPGGINDGFGFFISGPGINGPFSNNAVNIALVPSTTNPVTMFFVNCNPQNSPYYICNDPTNQQQFNMCPGNYNCPTTVGQTTVQYDGFTTVLTAVASVQCGQTYHIKLAIGDGGDYILDSGVFLEAGSFSSGGVVVGAASSGANIFGNDSTVYEGCGSLVVYFDRGPDTLLQDTISYTITGTATNGVDYTNINSQIIFQQGVDSLGVVINPVMDGISEGTEIIYIILNSLGPCNSTTNDTIKIYIMNVDPPTATITSTSVCPGDSSLLLATVIGGVRPYQYSWSQGITSTDSVAYAVPTSPTTYTLFVTDTCGNQLQQTVLVNITQPSAAFSSAFASANTVDFTDQSQTNIVSWFWDFGDGNTSTTPSPSHTYPNDQTYTFTVTLIVIDANGCADTTREVITIYPDFYFYTPNSFSPNGNGMNDGYGGVGTGILSYEMYIFNRWGELIFTSRDINTRWDGTYKGTKVHNEVFVAKFVVLGPNEQKIDKITHVTVAR